MKCTNCGKPLEGEELENPYKIKDDIVCDNCYDDKCERCVVCEENIHLDEKIEYVIIPEEIQSLIPGFYRILVNPFYADGMIEIHIFETHIEFVAPLEEDNEYQFGYAHTKCIPESPVILKKKKED